MNVSWNSWMDVEGPWKDERLGSIPIKDSYRGYDYYTIRNIELGFWCGYIKIPKNLLSKIELRRLYIHGDITWNKNHLPRLGKEEKEWQYIGFDCNHRSDICPQVDKVNATERTYRTHKWVIHHCHEIIDQIINTIKERDNKQ